MHTYNIYYENSDTDEPRRFLGTIQADSLAEALQLASQYYEIPSYDLVAEQQRERRNPHADLHFP